MTALELPWPPSVNHYWRFGNKHFYISKKGREYKTKVAKIIEKSGIRPFDGRVKVTIDAYPPDRRRRDLDNLEKCLLDACTLNKNSQTGLYQDDSQIKRKESTMWDAEQANPGAILLTIRPWTNTDASCEPAINAWLDKMKANTTQTNGDYEWQENAQKLSLPLVIATFQITVNQLWRRLTKWWNYCNRQTA